MGSDDIIITIKSADQRRPKSKKSREMTAEQKLKREIRLQKREERLHRKNIRLEKQRIRRAKQRRERASRAITSTAADPISAVSGGIQHLATKIPHIAIITMVAALFERIKSQLFAPGGIFDTRLRIEVGRQLNAFRSRQLARELATGKRVIRVSTSGGITGGEGLVGGNLYELAEGRQIQVDTAAQFAAGGDPR